MRSTKIPSIKSVTSISSLTLLHFAWRNLVSKKLRTFLTIFGVIIGIGAIYFLLSFGLGIQNLVTKQVIGNQSIKTIDISTPNSRILKLNQASVEKIQKLAHVNAISATYSFPGILKQKGSEVDTIVYGIDQSYQDSINLNLVAGKLLEDTDNKSVVINKAALTAIGFKEPKEALGKQINILIPLANSSATQESIEATFTIKGVVASGSGSEVFVQNFLFSIAGVPVYNQVRLSVDDTKNITSLRKQVESLGFQTSSPSDTIDQINQIFKFFNVILVSFGAVGMIVAVLGMFNTLTISLLERTKEIGLMIALGARTRDMRKLFTYEAVLLSASGAVIGIFTAFMGGRLVNLAMNSFSRSRGVLQSFELFSNPIWLIVGLTAFMIMVGLLVAYFPAKRAKTINPIDALRHE